MIEASASLASVQNRQERDLRNQKRWAGGVLAAMAALWAITHFIPLPAIALGYLRAASEAGMVGGLADWFAVTALFRRPLGLPIPHTNLIPENQRGIAEGVARYIDGQFLQHEMIVNQLRRANLADRLAKLLEQESNRTKIVDGLMRYLPRLLDKQRDRTVVEAIVAAVRQGTKNADMKPIFVKLLQGVTQNDSLMDLIKEMSEWARSWLLKNKGTVVAGISEKSGWYIPKFVDKKIATTIVEGLSGYLIDIQDENDEKGAQLRKWLVSLPSQIEKSDKIGERLTSIVGHIASDQELSNIVSAFWADAKDMIHSDIKKPDSKIRESLHSIVRSLSTEFDSVSLRNDINSNIEQFLTDNIPIWRKEISQMIVGTLTAQEPMAFSRRIELQVGRDLQFIRINGTVIGSLVGVFIHAINGLI